jgi:hypothetical protein
MQILPPGSRLNSCSSPWDGVTGTHASPHGRIQDSLAHFSTICHPISPWWWWATGGHCLWVCYSSAVNVSEVEGELLWEAPRRWRISGSWMLLQKDDFGYFSPWSAHNRNNDTEIIYWGLLCARNSFKCFVIFTHFNFISILPNRGS